MERSLERGRRWQEVEGDILDEARIEPATSRHVQCLCARGSKFPKFGPYRYAQISSIFFGFFNLIKFYSKSIKISNNFCQKLPKFSKF